MSTLLRPDAASCVSTVPQLNAAHLVSGGFTGYNGCVVFEIADLAKGTVAPGIVRSITAAENRFNGACSFAEETGWVVSMLRLDTAAPFRMYRTGVTSP